MRDRSEEVSLPRLGSRLGYGWLSVNRFLLLMMDGDITLEITVTRGGRKPCLVMGNEVLGEQQVGGGK